MITTAKPKRKPVALAPSRIRREPVREQTKVPQSNERQMWLGMTGVVLFAAAFGILILGIAIVTAFKAATAQPPPFGQCYSAGGADCVLDGDSIRVEGATIDIAGIEAPRIRDAACPEERERGIAAALKLSDILKSGTVAVGPPRLDELGREVRAVKVSDQDAGARMLAASLARPTGGERKWCR